jgi:hypothetical protein
MAFVTHIATFPEDLAVERLSDSENDSENESGGSSLPGLTGQSDNECDGGSAMPGLEGHFADSD